MAIKSLHTIIVLDNDGFSMTAVNACEDDPASTRCSDRGADRDRDIRSAMKDLPARAKGICAPPHARGHHTVIHRQ